MKKSTLDYFIHAPMEIIRLIQEYFFYDWGFRHDIFRGDEKSWRRFLQSCKSLSSLKRMTLFLNLNRESSIKYLRQVEYREEVKGRINNPAQQISLNLSLTKGQLLLDDISREEIMETFLRDIAVMVEVQYVNLIYSDYSRLKELKKLLPEKIDVEDDRLFCYDSTTEAVAAATESTSMYCYLHFYQDKCCKRKTHFISCSSCMKGVCTKFTVNHFNDWQTCASCQEPHCSTRRHFCKDCLKTICVNCRGSCCDDCDGEDHCIECAVTTEKVLCVTCSQQYCQYSATCVPCDQPCCNTPDCYVSCASCRYWCCLNCRVSQIRICSSCKEEVCVECFIPCNSCGLEVCAKCEKIPRDKIERIQNNHIYRCNNCSMKKKKGKETHSIYYKKWNF